MFLAAAIILGEVKLIFSGAMGGPGKSHEIYN